MVNSRCFCLTGGSGEDNSHLLSELFAVGISALPSCVLFFLVGLYVSCFPATSFCSLKDKKLLV